MICMCSKSSKFQVSAFSRFEVAAFSTSGCKIRNFARKKTLGLPTQSVAEIPINSEALIASQRLCS